MLSSCSARCVGACAPRMVMMMCTQMANMLEGGGKTPLLRPDQLRAMGFKIVAYPLSLLGVSVRGRGWHTRGGGRLHCHAMQRTADGARQAHACTGPARRFDGISNVTHHASTGGAACRSAPWRWRSRA